MSVTDYFVLCETTTRDEKGRISLINIFDSITADTLPAKPGKIAVAFSFEIKPQQLHEPQSLTIEIDDPSGDNLFRAQGNVSTGADAILPDGTQAARIISALNINSPTFNQYGEYMYRLKLNDETLHENCLRVLDEKSISNLEGKAN